MLAKSPGIVKKKEIVLNSGLIVLVNHWVKIKQNEKRDKYLDLARELKQTLGNKKVTVIPIVIGVVRTIPKGLVKGLKELEFRGRAETIETTALLRILRRVLDILGHLLSLRLQLKNIS